MPQGYDISIRYCLNQDVRVFGHKFQPLWSQVAVANDPMAAAAAKVWPKNTCGSWRGEMGRSWKAKRCQVFWGCYKRDLPSCHISHLGKRLRRKVQASNSWFVCLNWLQIFYTKSLHALGSESGFRFPWNDSIQYFHAFHHFCLTPSSNKEIFVATFAGVSCWNSCLPTGHGRQITPIQASKRIHFFNLNGGLLLILFWDPYRL